MEVATRLTSDYPADAGAIALLGKVCQQQGDTTEALKCWQRSLELDPGYSDAYLGMAVVAFEKAQYAESIKLWKKVTELNPSKPGVNNFVARALICLGKPQEAIEALRRDIQISPRASHSHFLLGQRYLQAKEYDQAKKSLLAAIEIRPGYTSAYYGLATVSARLGQKEESKQYREKFKELQTQDLKSLQDQSATFDDLLNARGQASGSHTRIGLYYHTHGNSQTAERLWRRAATLDPKKKDCRVYLAGLYERAGRDRDLLRMYEEIRQIEPDNGLVYARIGELNLQMGQFDAAEEAFRKIIELKPERSEGYAWLAQLYLHTGKNLPEAKKLAATAVGRVPSAENYSILGEACDRNGDRAGALAALKQAMKLDPGSEGYKRMYKQIEQKK